MGLPFYPQIIWPNPSGLSPISSGGCYTMETNETGSGFGCGSTSIKVREELTIREELQMDVDIWLGDVV
jgi:hypothetical protein